MRPVVSTSASLIPMPRNIGADVLSRAHDVGGISNVTPKSRHGPGFLPRCRAEVADMTSDLANRVLNRFSMSTTFGRCSDIGQIPVPPSSGVDLPMSIACRNSRHCCDTVAYEMGHIPLHMRPPPDRRPCLGGPDRLGITRNPRQPERAHSPNMPLQNNPGHIQAPLAIEAVRGCRLCVSWLIP